MSTEKPLDQAPPVSRRKLGVAGVVGLVVAGSGVAAAQHASIRSFLGIRREKS